MSVPSRALNRTNASTKQLWQIAEAGDLTELEAILKKGADVNGCNRNGVSALMRASSAGHHVMVQALLEHGADIHAHRDDGFTALLLATFFGHAATVRVLVEHGADLDQTTRCGNTPEDWARARAFDQIASYLNDARRTRRTQAPAPPIFKQNAERAMPKPVLVEGVFSEVRRPSVATTPQAEPPLDKSDLRVPEVRTLKDPPEIWELVHSAPPQFNPGTAFISRATSSWANRILFCLSVCLLAGAGTFGILKFRNASTATTTRPVEIAQPASAPPVIQSTNSPENVATSPTESSPAITPGVETGALPATVSPLDSVSTVASHASTSVRSQGRRTKAPVADFEPNAKEPVKAVSEVQPVAPKPERTTVDSADAQNRKKSTPNGLSPQLIGPASPGATPKPKVIQWP